jgi:hypothetical protein
MAIKRHIRFTRESTVNLRENQRFEFARKHALEFYRQNAIYTFIPKNGCSTMRYTLALENGVIEEPDEIKWIHQNNPTFSADLRTLIKAQYTFVILRDPFRRLASVFLDKFIAQTPDAFQHRQLLDYKKDISKFSFRNFVESLERKHIRDSNIHWQPQMHFLVYKKYDDYFCLEKFPEVIKTLKEKIGIEVKDARNLIKHGLDQYEMVDEGRPFADVPLLELINMKAEGQVPHPKDLFDEALIQIATEQFDVDFHLYTSLFGKEGLLFPEALGESEN